MKIAISADGEKLSDNVSEFFGRCPYFIFVETEGGKSVKNEALENEVAGQSGGAGIATANLMADRNVEVVIAKSVGPRAMDVLNQFKIKVYNGEGRIEEVIKNFIENK